MKYILDSNVALKWVLPEIDSDKALRLRAKAQAGVHELLVYNSRYLFRNKVSGPFHDFR